ncbi:hypothetical protein LOS78_01705 [Paracoccus sp. MA]|uniref:hypothetical protein n=1 Tax=Paracoccus sp. MA TaxID=2895796 RepID=UPI001E5282E8|nr:hypothetical protein [Paracoccus sp. MA]UFM64214.1 hypothetical protein LOS78_01705 [Paracoccus sp. MA]
MSGIEKVVAAALFGGCLAALTVVLAVAIGGDRQFLVAILDQPLRWLDWPACVGAVGAAAHRFTKL